MIVIFTFLLNSQASTKSTFFRIMSVVLVCVPGANVTLRHTVYVDNALLVLHILPNPVTITYYMH